MGTKLAGKLLSSVTSYLPHRVGTCEGIVLKAGERAVAVIMTVALWGITERVVVGVDLEFYVNVDERYVGDDGGVSTTSRDIERNIRFNFGFVLAEVYVPMTVSVHEIEARRVRSQRTNLKDSYKYT